MIRLFFLCSLLLTQRAFAEPCAEKWENKESSLYQCGPVKVVRISGAPKERAALLGKMIAEGSLSREVVRYFSEKMSDELRRDAGFLASPLRLLYHQVVRLSHRGTPPALAEEIDAMSRSLGVDPIYLRRGLTLPDTGTLLQGLGSFPFLGFLPTPGCTSAAARLDHGTFVYGRNLDFAGVGVWDKNPMLLLVDPPSGSGELRHLVIGADGLLFGGITGANEAGLTFAVHQNFTKDVGLYGVPVVLIGELVLRQARSLEDAEAILGKHRPASLWTFVVTDLKSGETMAVESSPKQFHVRRGEENLFVQTNHAMNEKTRESENASLGMRANSIFRMKRAFEMLERNAPSAALLARVLSYQDNAEGQLSAYHDILKAETLQSVIFESAIGKSATLYLSVDEAPAASGRYAAFPLAALWNRETPQMKIVDFLRTSVERRLEQRHTAEAFRLYFDEREPYAAYEKLRYQRTLNAALFRAVALYQSDRFAESLQEAAAALRDNTFLTEPVYIRDSLEWVWLANLLRLGRRDDARNLAQKILEKDDGKSLPPRLSGIARGVLQNRYISVWDLNLAFDFFSGDLSGRDH